MKFEKSAERQTKNTIEYYKNLDNIEEVPIDILRAMYKDLLEELRNSISKKKIKDKIENLETRKAECDDIESKVRLDVKINSYKELLEDK